MQFHEIEEGGQTVADMAAGVRRPVAPTHLKAVSEDSDGAHEVKRLIDDNSRNTNELVKLAGTMAYREPLELDGDVDLGTVSHLEYAEYNSGVYQEPATMVVGDVEALLDSSSAYQVVGSAVSANLTGAFRSLHANRQPNFTVAWWAKAETGFKAASGSWDGGVEELAVTDAASGATYLRVRFVEGEGLPKGGGWVVQFSSAPACEETDSVCKRSPAFWCQGPVSSAYAGIWRHFALRVSQGSESSSASLFLDGFKLCGVTFDSDQQLLPHLR